MNLPQAFQASLQQQFGHQQADAILDALHEPAFQAIRLNPKKSPDRPKLESVAWNQYGYYITERPSYIADPWWHAGVYYVQEPSSMMTGELIRQLKRQYFTEGSVRVLDLCAAPGGKSTDILAYLDEQDLLVANETIQSRATILNENVTKWGYANCLVTNADPRQFQKLGGFFDILVVDAPCSGEGLFRKDSKAIGEWSEENVQLCYQRQQRILADAWDCLSDNGILIYSTCTFNVEENEGVLNWLLNNYKTAPAMVDIDSSWNFYSHEVQPNYLIYKSLPGKTKGEGFSFFIVMKKESTDAIKLSKTKGNKAKVTYGFEVDIEGEMVMEHDQLFFRTHPSEMQTIYDRVKTIKSGCLLGTLKRDKLIPTHEVAMLNSVKIPYPTIEVTLEAAQAFLRSDTFDLTYEVKGYNLLYYNHICIGIINHLGNRFNNLYPSPWRIRKSGQLDYHNIFER